MPDAGELIAREFNRGVLIATSTLINHWGHGTETQHLLNMIDADEAMIRSMDFTEYDSEPLLTAVRARASQSGDA